METDTESMSDEELMDMVKRLSTTTPTGDEKHNVHTFLQSVAITDDTTKLGYLTEQELGMPELPVRADKNLSLISGEIAENEFFKEYFLKESEHTTSTSLSKNAKLLTLAVIQKREIADVTKRKINKGWFAKKDKKEEE